MMNHQVKTNASSRECVGEHSKVRQQSQSPIETAQNVPVHFEGKNVAVHFSKPPTAQNVPVHFEGGNVAVNFSKRVHFSKPPTAQNVPVNFEGSSGRERPAARLQWDTVMAVASRWHNCNGQRWRRQRKGWQDGGKITMNNDYGNGQLWVQAGVGGRSG